MPIRHLCLAVLALGFVTAPSALAGAPGKWTQLGQANLRNIDEAALARTPDGTLHVVWRAPGGPNADALIHDSVGPNGVVAPPNTITSGWASITAVPDLLATSDGLRVIFGGIRTIKPDETNQNMNTATAPASGATWDLQTGTIATGDSAYAGDVGAALLGDGTPIFAWSGTGAGVYTHKDLDPAAPNFAVQGQLGGCCGYHADVAVDQESGAPFIAWYSNADKNFGIFGQSLDPITGGPSGAPVLMPGSTATFNGTPNSSEMPQRTPIVARAGGGVYVAFAGGYPTTKQYRLWRIADSKSAVLATSPNNHITGLAADGQGRLWACWIDRASKPLIFARRSNKAATKFGPAVKVGLPKGTGDSAWKIACNAQTEGAVDIVALLGSPNIAQWHTQILPGLDIAGSPKKKGGAVTLTVTDPEAVKGAKVTIGGASGTTNASGKVTLSLRPSKAKRLTATARKTGYTTATEKLATK